MGPLRLSQPHLYFNEVDKGRHFVHFGARPRDRAPARRGGPWRARERTGVRDENWADWYAEYLAAEQAGRELPQ